MTGPADLAGCQFGRLTVSGPSDVRIFRGRTVLCRCRCGGSISVRPGDLRKGKVKSCGCYRRELALAALQRANQPEARSRQQVSANRTRHRKQILALGSVTTTRQYIDGQPAPL